MSLGAWLRKDHVRSALISSAKIGAIPFFAIGLPFFLFSIFGITTLVAQLPSGEHLRAYEIESAQIRADDLIWMGRTGPPWEYDWTLAELKIRS
ncbi:MAG: hypothetical protein AAF226_19450, partial [Verrucomicrobiota bacterium]